MIFPNSILYGQPNRDLNTIYDLFGSQIEKANPAIAIRVRPLFGKSIKFEIRDQEKDRELIDIISTDNSLLIKANSKDALTDGMFIYLNRLGFRYYFPSETWHYYPTLHTIFLPMKSSFEPTFINRRIWYGYGTGSESASKDYNFWVKANCLRELVPGTYGHVYETIISDNKAEFLKHPEYFAVNVERGKIPKNAKFNVENKELQKLVVADALKRAEKAYKKYGDRFMISMEPSDGKGFCETCTSLRTPSEQVYFLANLVAKELKRYYPFAFVALYAYNQHSQPPHFKLEDNIIIYIATAYNSTNYTYEELFKLWSLKAKTIGVRDYLGVTAWDLDLPGGGKAVNLSQLSQDLRFYARNNSKLYTAETTNGWIAKGLGHYITSKMLWDTASSINVLKNDFFSTMFPSTKKMAFEVFNKISSYKRGMPIDNDLDEWLNIGLTAIERASNRLEKQRWEDILAYVNTIYFYREYTRTPSKETLVKLFKYGYKNIDRSIYGIYALERRMSTILKKYGIETSGLTNGQDSSDRQYAAYIKRNLKPQKWNRYDYKNFKVSLDSKKESRAHPHPALRGVKLYLLNISKNSQLTMYAGLIKSAKQPGADMYLFAKSDSGLNNPILYKHIEPSRNINLRFNDIPPGEYWMKVDDKRNGSKIIATENLPYLIVGDADHKFNSLSRSNFYFYISKDVRYFTLNIGMVATIKAPDGKVYEFQKNNNLSVNFEVSDRQHGVWEVLKQSGFISIDGAYPYFMTRRDWVPMIEN
ncbi:hypothetical protein GCM10027051_00980 [Niabella terrae]